MYQKNGDRIFFLARARRHISTMSMFLAVLCCALVLVASNAFSIHLEGGAGASATTDDPRIREMIWRMTTYFSSMVDTSSSSDDPRFYLVSRPPTNEFVHQHCPIRELGVTWDATTILNFWNLEQEWLRINKHDELFVAHKDRLERAVRHTLQFYNAPYDSVDGDGVMLHPDALLESPNIAHSAFCILATIGAMRLSLLKHLPPIDALTKGILSMQRPDGAFRIQFGAQDVKRGIEFYPGEAMVALMEVYGQDGDEKNRKILRGKPFFRP
jgi:hypothetical protein